MQTSALFLRSTWTMPQRMNILLDKVSLKSECKTEHVDVQSRNQCKTEKDQKNLIKEENISNGGKPMILLSHSLGVLFVLQLLNQNSTYASGNTVGVFLVKPLIVRDEQRSSESSLQLLPNPNVSRMNQSPYLGGSPLFTLILLAWVLQVCYIMINN